MSSKMKVIFELNTNQGSKIKLLAIHPIKQWVGIINENNTFSLWNYQQKILIKSFSCNTLDDNKVVEIKQIVFFDKQSLCGSGDTKSMKNNIIFVTSNKLIFYDYVSDAIRQTSEKELDQKSIRKVCVYSQNKICIAVSDGSFKVLDSRDNQAKGSMYIRTVKGYHIKPIAWIFSYSQNYNEMPRVITASDQDGMMACWNVDMILKSPPNMQFAIPSFKFQSAAKKSKQSIGNQQILFLQYDPSSYRLITANEQHIRLWSTMTGMQVKRIKNQFKLKQILFFNHFSYLCQSLIAHSKTNKFFVIRNLDGTTAISNEIDLRNFFVGVNTQNPQQQLQVSHAYSFPHHPSNLFIVTNYNMAILELDKFYCPPYGYHSSFITKFSTINSRDLINKAEGELRKNISAEEINNLKFEQDILLNTFFLSADEESVHFNLLQVQYSTMLHESRKYKMFSFDKNSPFRQGEGVRPMVLVNFEGNEIIIFNRMISYYEIYRAQNDHEANDLLQHHQEVSNRIDFFSKFYLVTTGYCRDIVYHQYKNQFAAIVGFDDKDKIVQYKQTKDKKGNKMVLSAQPTKYKIHIYQKVGNQYGLFDKSDYFVSKLYKIYSFGSFFAYTTTKGTHQLIQIISKQKNEVRQIQGILNCPQQIYVSYCQSYYVFSYDKYFIVFKVQQNGTLSYFRSFQFTLLHGYFWEKFFFFLTEKVLYFMHILNDDSIVIKIADISNFKVIQKIIDDIEDDDFEPQCELLPPGQQQILTIVNMSLVLLNESGNPTLVALNGFPYIIFCLQIASGALEETNYLYKKASKNIAKLMRQTMTNYAMIAPDLMG